MTQLLHIMIAECTQWPIVMSGVPKKQQSIHLLQKYVLDWLVQKFVLLCVAVWERETLTVIARHIAKQDNMLIAIFVMVSGGAAKF